MINYDFFYRHKFFTTVVLWSLVCILWSVQGCKKDEPLTDNPYDFILRDDTTNIQIPVDSLNITYIHEKILSTRCALPGCHVGSFEPDFRTPQSSFSTLVYSPIKKNNASNSFKYRVIPFDVNKSVLYQRVSNCCFANQGDQMPQDNNQDTSKLSQASINLIAQWIANGARDMFGKVAHLPNAEPVINPVYFALGTDYTTVYSNTRLDSVYYNPFVVPQNVTSFYIGVQVTDDSLAQNQMQYNKLKISTIQDNFSGATTLTGSYVSIGGFSGWLITVPASSLPSNDTLYMRYYVNDGSQVNNTEFPRTDMLFPYKTYWSFIRQ